METIEQTSVETSEGWRQGTSKQANKFVSERVNEGKSEVGREAASN